MTKIAVILLVISLFVSCKEKTNYQKRILIKNESNNTWTIKVFPKSKYLSGNLYDFSNIGGGYREKEFLLEIDSEVDLYSSADLKIKPNLIATQVFDSIHLIPFNENKTVIKFSPDTVIGYAENLYTDDSVWSFEIRNFDLPTMFKSHPVESHDHIFTISESKY